MITTAHTLGTSYALPMHGAHNPSTGAQGTTPGSFALRADVGGPRAFASPDTPGMPQPSDRTAWDFLPEGWKLVSATDHATGCAEHQKTLACLELCTIRQTVIRSCVDHRE
ncbi:MAG: hypothetical protein EBZ84_08220 [Betaproteobacteria bacterium]|nr:hypothetical protein [Betaproteobacteria bacterium]